MDWAEIPNWVLTLVAKSTTTSHHVNECGLMLVAENNIIDWDTGWDGWDMDLNYWLNDWAQQDTRLDWGTDQGRLRHMWLAWGMIKTVTETLSRDTGDTKWTLWWLRQWLRYDWDSTPAWQRYRLSIEFGTLTRATENWLKWLYNRLRWLKPWGDWEMHVT